MARRTLVFGPAYLDRVLRVDRPLVEPGAGGPLDQSVDGRSEFGPGLTLLDPGGASIEIELPPGWPGPTGVVTLSRAILSTQSRSRREVSGVAWHDDLGGMGAGYAKALGGVLTSALGPPDDPMSRAVSDLVARSGITHRPIRVEGSPADWTLLVTSAEFGDKLPIGFRGCHAALELLPAPAEPSCDLLVVAARPNRLAAQVLRGDGALVRFFAPAMRNMLDRDCPISGFADAIDVMTCNRREWENLDDREEVAWRLSVLAITDGPAGSVVRFTDPSGEAGLLRIPAFPRRHPPRDTNRAGEAFASAFLGTLLDGGWTPGVAEESLVRRAALRASAAAALVLDRSEFGFPTSEQIDEALRAGEVG
jgi:sugar/nucleoside kinase (ribokinase family)